MITVTRTDDVVAIALDVRTAKLLELVCGRDATVSMAIATSVDLNGDYAITQPELKKVLGEIYYAIYNA